MLETPEQTTYNVCSGKGTSIREMLDWILEEAGIGPAITVDPERMRDGDPPRIVGSPNRLRHETGWEASRNVRDGVRDTYSWVRRSGNIH
jgi:nucleoside-diphosphate-sugar epimerase